jgi:hypothetical protein
MWLAHGRQQGAQCELVESTCAGLRDTTSKVNQSACPRVLAQAPVGLNIETSITRDTNTSRGVNHSRDLYKVNQRIGQSPTDSSLPYHPSLENCCHDIDSSPPHRMRIRRMLLAHRSSTRHRLRLGAVRRYQYRLDGTTRQRPRVQVF